MAAGNTLATNVTELIPEITLEVQYIYQDAAIGPALAQFRSVDGVAGNTVEFPRFTEVSGSTGVAEDGTPTSHQMDLTMPTLTLARRSVYVIMSGLALRGATGDVVSQVGRAMGMAKAKQDDTAIFGVTLGTTDYATSAGATNAALSITNALAGLLVMKQNEVNERINCVCHVTDYADIRAGLTPVANDDAIAVSLASDMAREAFVSRAFGMNWFETNRISSTTKGATANVRTNLIFVESGLGYAHAWSPGNSGVEIDRQAKSDTYDLVINYYDAAGVIHGPGVCDLLSTTA